MRRFLALAAIALVPTALLAGGPATGQTDEQVRRGFELFVAGCASCHGVEGQGTGTAPPLVGVGPAAVDFMLSTGRMPLGDPDAQPVRRPPAYDEDDIAAIVAYVSSLGPGGAPIPAVAPQRGDLVTGRALYVANCLACHGAGAQGASVGGGQVAPPLDRGTATEIAEAVRVGPGVMPPFGEGQLSDRDLDSVLRYVLALRERVDRGGLGLGHVGPVVEGLIGWAVGLGILVLVVRLTGSRS